MALKDELISATYAILDALAKMSNKERELEPTKTFADHYNKIRGEAVKLGEKQTFLPPAVLTDGNVVKARYLEIDAYCRTIISLLDEGSAFASDSQ